MQKEMNCIGGVVEMDVKKELFKAKVKTYILMQKDGYGVESPYLYPIDDLEGIIVKLLGLSEQEDEALSYEAIDWAKEILDMIEKKDEL